VSSLARLRAGTIGLLALAVVLAVPGCGGRFDRAAPAPFAPAGSSTGTTQPDFTSIGPGSQSTPALLPGNAVAGSPPVSVAPPLRATVAGDPQAATKLAIYNAYETFLYDLSGMDDTLNQSWVPRLTQVATTRLAVAVVRQARTLLAAHEHGAGLLRDDKMTIDVINTGSAALADCQNERDFYVVMSNKNPDPGISRGYYVGAAQLVNSGGKWLVDVFTTTHLTCSY